MMSFESNLCFTCLKSNETKLIAVTETDVDNISYLNKLLFCIPELVRNENIEICLGCAESLKISYHFRQMVLDAQNSLNNCEDIDPTLNFENTQDFLSNHSTEDVIEHSQFKNISEENLNVKDNLLDVVLDINNEKNCLLNEQESGEVCKHCNLLFNDLSEHDCKEKPKIKIRNRYVPKITVGCEICAMKFNKKWKLNKHMNKAHSSERKYTCSFCGSSFKQSFHLREHLTRHTGERKFNCTVCEKKFQRASSLKRHMVTHDLLPGQKTKKTPFLCNICGKSFPYSNGAQRHMRTHTGEKKFQCEICKKTFAQSTHLQVHKRVHTGEKPYICDTCGDCFSLRATLQKHLKVHYNNSTEQQSNKETKQIKTEEKIFENIVNETLELLDENKDKNVEYEGDFKDFVVYIPP